MLIKLTDAASKRTLLVNTDDMRSAAWDAEKKHTVIVSVEPDQLYVVEEGLEQIMFAQRPASK
jgi:hypothetical protein